MPETAISVVMGVYNGAPRLAQTIESVLAQTCGDFEFLIINDGSTDRQVAAILAAYAARDARMAIVNKHNEGLTVALAEGCRRARGAYIARIDVGDVMAPERLSAQKAVLDAHPGCHLVSCAVSFHGPDWEELWVNRGRPATVEPVTVLSERDGDGLQADIPHHGSVMFRRSAYAAAGGYRPAFYYGQDWDLWYRLAEAGSFCVVPRVLYRARFFPDAISMAQSQRQQCIAQLSLAAHQLRKRGLPDLAVVSRAQAFRPSRSAADRERGGSAAGYYFIGEALRRRGNPECRAYFLQAIKGRPWSLKSWLRLLQSTRLRGSRDSVAEW
ncbi:MAG: glycosyltransferase family 2 protein [Halioglobus sp.]|nr:glycosyltransferase family 2 protein [Halioglobus sp.]